MEQVSTVPSSFPVEPDAPVTMSRVECLSQVDSDMATGTKALHWKLEKRFLSTAGSQLERGGFSTNWLGLLLRWETLEKPNLRNPTNMAHC